MNVRKFVMEVRNVVREAVVKRKIRIKIDYNIFSSALVEIRAAEGGDDAKLLVKDFFEIYSKYCKLKKFEIEISYISYGNVGWAKVEFTVSGPRVYKEFLPESGGHRIQRTPPTEKRGRKHTSTITVAVLPIIDNEIYIDKRDLEWDTFRSSGPGGQNVNKVETGVRVKHKPSGLEVCIQSGRSQRRNKDLAFKLLSSKIYSEEVRKSMDEDNARRREQIKYGLRSEKIKTYRESDNTVIDHRTETKIRLDRVKRGFIKG